MTQRLAEQASTATDINKTPHQEGQEGCRPAAQQPAVGRDTTGPEVLLEEQADGTPRWTPLALGGCIREM